NPDSATVTPQRSKVSKLLLKKGDVFSVQYGGGGGRGKPYDRPVEQVLEDVWNGYISNETARRVYGVVVEGWPPKVDENETKRLRS
ncbi:MAG: hydantoinase B/oxoprolinase family protein, partial [Candidatus Binatia bacterium]